MKAILQYTFIFLLSAGLWACSDSGSGGSDSENRTPPQLPKLEQSVTVDISYFEQNEPKQLYAQATSTTTNYYMGKQFVLFVVGSFTFGPANMGFLNSTYGQTAEYNDGQWVWTYGATTSGVSVSFEMIAKELTDAIHWELYWSASSAEVRFEDYKFMEGTVSKDGTTGEWSIYSFAGAMASEEEILLRNVTWSNSENSSEIVSKVFNSNDETLTVSYTRNGADYTMTITGPDGESNVTWNTETKEGSITEEGATKCWGSNFQNIPCS